MDWDDAVSDEVKKDWKKWLETSNILHEFCIPRNFLLEHTELRNDTEYQLHGSVMLRTLRFLALSICVALALVKHKSVL